MRKAANIRVYLDTSVLGGYYDPEFSQETRALFALIRAGRISAVISEMVYVEVLRAPEPIRALLDELGSIGAQTLTIDEAALDLQEAYLKAGAVSRRWEEDALHVALASIGRVDVIASWNFKHLVDPRRVKGFNGVNLAMGYGLVEIRSPVDIVRTVEAEK